MHSSKRPAARRLGAVILAAFLTSAAVASPQSNAFDAQLALTETIAFTGAPPCFGIGTVQAAGKASFLGKVTATSSDCINPQGTFDPGSTANSFSFSSTGSGPAGLVFTATSGELLFATYSGTLTPQPSGPHRIDGQFTITGGTGRYLGATGGGTLSGYEDISQVVSGRGVVQMVGTIVY